ncbi:helix-turn-helix transcriptional regulator [Stutzerimonas nitrititolerans]|uniref:helix-turn-helix domain-containing protein n=1 Tax=Stutzerimonas nitrititolerans TaxID=2482751 RepID=UPI0028B1D2BB|nr:helix-turn-helix transcriptional regulator [Stutzerimonas nitrititolerans]
MSEIDQKHLAEAVGRAIAKQRVRAGMTQEHVAERLGIGSEAISRIERGIVIPNISRLLEFAAIFECEAADLLTEASPRTDDQAQRISRMLATISPADRQLILGLVEQLADRLAEA